MSRNGFSCFPNTDQKFLTIKKFILYDYAVN